MTTYILKRLILMVPTLIGLTALVFALTRFAPGDPAAQKLGVGGGSNQMSGNQSAKELVAKFRKDWNLDKPVHEQYLIWMGKLIKLDFGKSFKDSRPVSEKIGERLGVTLWLNLLSLFLTYLIAIPLGIYSSVRRGTALDRAITFFLFILYSLPSFFVAILLILYFCNPQNFDIFPLRGLTSENYESLSFLGKMGDRLWHLVLPVICLTYGSLAYVSRQMRSSMLEVIRQDYVRTARAKGLPERTVILKHALRNSLIPIITLISALLPSMIAGSVIVEKIFTIQGLGLLSFEAILTRDYNVILAIFTISCFLTLLSNLLADIMYAYVNPTIQLR